MRLLIRRSCLLLLLALPWTLASVATPNQEPPKRSDVDDPVIAAGLLAWRKPGGKLNSACSSCHSPDGFDLAAFNFSPRDIIRRAQAHVPMEDARKILEMVLAIRERYKIERPLDPRTVRPLQPGGEVLPGATPEARDLAFGVSLQALLPTVMSGRIETLDQARRARSEVLAVDLKNLRIGIPLNLWSEDLFHGDEHGLLADWIADLPSAPNPAATTAWTALQDRYIAQPTDANLWSLVEAAPTHTVPFSKMPFAMELSLSKYRAMLVAQHQLRRTAMGLPQTSGAAPKHNPFWEVGHYAANNEMFDGDSQGMPDDILGSLDPKMPIPMQMKGLKAPWLWLGWLQDPSLQRTPGDIGTSTGRYFTMALWRDGNYAFHNAFMIARKQLEQSAEPSAGFVLDYSEFAAHGNLQKYEPTDPERRELFRPMTANLFRMSLLLVADEAVRTRQVAGRATAKFQVEAIRTWLISSEPERAEQNGVLVDAALKAIEASTEWKRQ